jgi:hypothetical protein
VATSAVAALAECAARARSVSSASDFPDRASASWRLLPTRAALSSVA